MQQGAVMRVEKRQRPARPASHTQGPSRHFRGDFAAVWGRRFLPKPRAPIPVFPCPVRGAPRWELDGGRGGPGRAFGATPPRPPPVLVSSGRGAQHRASTAPAYMRIRNTGQWQLQGALPWFHSVWPLIANMQLAETFRYSACNGGYVVSM